MNRIVKSNTQPPLPVLRTIVRDCAKALCFLKSKGIIHCDLKPENILFLNNKSQNVKVIDFGSATFINDVDYSYLQSRPYRAPELTFGCPFDFQADIWSLGCIVYELISGKKLFRYKTVEENLVKALAIDNRCGFAEFSDGKNWADLTVGDKFVRGREGETGVTVGVIIPEEKWNFREELNELKCGEKLKDFILGCLKINPDERMTPEKALKHPFCGSD